MVVVGSEVVVVVVVVSGGCMLRGLMNGNIKSLYLLPI